MTRASDGWSDPDLDAGVAFVVWQIQRGEGGGQVQQNPKTPHQDQRDACRSSNSCQRARVLSFL
jgi:hypothetical protein